MTPATPTAPLWLYDGDCGICADGSARIRDVVAPPVEMASYQSVDLAELGVDESAVLEGPVLRLPDGSYRVGPEAMGTMLSLAGYPYRAVGSIMLAPGHLGISWCLVPCLLPSRPSVIPSCSI